MYRKIIFNNAASITFHLLLCLISLITYGTGEPGLIRPLHHEYTVMLVGVLFLLLYLAFGCFVLKDTGSSVYNLLSVSSIPVLLLAVFIYYKLNFKGELVFFVYPFEVFEFNNAFRCIIGLLAPSALMWAGIVNKKRKKLVLSLLLIFITLLALLISLEV